MSLWETQRKFDRELLECIFACLASLDSQTLRLYCDKRRYVHFFAIHQTTDLRSISRIRVKFRLRDFLDFKIKLLTGQKRGMSGLACEP